MRSPRPFAVTRGGGRGVGVRRGDGPVNPAPSAARSDRGRPNGHFSIGLVNSRDGEEASGATPAGDPHEGRRDGGCRFRRRSRLRWRRRAVLHWRPDVAEAWAELWDSPLAGQIKPTDLPALTRLFEYRHQLAEAQARYARSRWWWARRDSRCCRRSQLRFIDWRVYRQVRGPVRVDAVGPVAPRCDPGGRQVLASRNAALLAEFKAGSDALRPTYGPLAAAWIETNLVHGEGDRFGQPFSAHRRRAPLPRSAVAL